MEACRMARRPGMEKQLKSKSMKAINSTPNHRQITVNQRLDRSLGVGPAPFLAPRRALLGRTSLLAAGCTVVSYRNEHGERFSRVALGARTSITSLAVEAQSNGVRRIELRGYQNDAAQALSTVTEAAVRAAIDTRQP
jgi:hypothetical protein